MTGSRSITEQAYVCDALHAVWILLAMMRQPQLTVIHGNCPQGPDRHADNWAAMMAGSSPTIQVEPYSADWKKFGKAAGPIRNSVMIGQNIDLVLAFWDGVSRGTANMVELAIQRKVPYLLRTVR